MFFYKVYDCPDGRFLYFDEFEIYLLPPQRTFSENSCKNFTKQIQHNTLQKMLKIHKEGIVWHCERKAFCRIVNDASCKKVPVNGIHKGRIPLGQFCLTNTMNRERSSLQLFVVV